MHKNYLQSVKKQFEYYKLLGEKTIEQINENEMFWQYNEDSNSIAIIVNHLSGNMRSRWTNFLTSDGEKDFRDRDSEFEIPSNSKQELIEKWKLGWKSLFDALNSINEDNFRNIIYIRNEGHTIVEAINRQLGHYSYHIGQIVFLGKMIKGEKWKNLSIPKGNSTDFNRVKFSKEKHKTHFTDEYLKRTR